MDMKSFDVVAIGNAIVDVIVAVDDPFLADQAVPKGSMTLIDMDQATLIYKNLRDSRQISGGSAANTCLLYTSPSPRDKRQSRMPSSA